MDTHRKMRVHVSAMVDGELPAGDAELAMAALHTPDGRQSWQLYHRIGDVLRAEAAPALSDGFAARLAARLEAEAPPLRRSQPKSGDSSAAKRNAARASQASAPPAPAAALQPASAKEELAVEAKAVVTPKPAVVSIN